MVTFNIILMLHNKLPKNKLFFNGDKKGHQLGYLAVPAADDLKKVDFQGSKPSKATFIFTESPNKNQ